MLDRLQADDMFWNIVSEERFPQVLDYAWNQLASI